MIICDITICVYKITIHKVNIIVTRTHGKVFLRISNLRGLKKYPYLIIIIY